MLSSSVVIFEFYRDFPTLSETTTPGTTKPLPLESSFGMRVAGGTIDCLRLLLCADRSLLLEFCLRLSACYSS